MDNKIKLAVAGAGKTFDICNSINPDKKNLIIAFTNQNINNIKKELIKAHGKIPEFTNVLTFHKFMYRYIICPYEPSILNCFKVEKFKNEGPTSAQPPPQNIKVKKKYIYNPKYIKQDKFGHYINRNQYYLSRMSKLIVKTINGKKKLTDRLSVRLNSVYDKILVDEFQDFREYDYELLMALSKKANNFVLVGDYYQHSVSGVQNTGKPFKIKRRYISYDEFKKECEKYKFKVDTTSLVKSRRCPEEICDFVRQKLNINFYHHPENINNGKVVFVKNDLEKILEDDKIVKLVHENSHIYTFRAINGSYSKGDTYKNVCVVLTEKLSNLDNENFDCSKISNITKNKLYVALTRTKGNLYIVKKQDFDLVKEKYIRENII